LRQADRKADAKQPVSITIIDRPSTIVVHDHCRYNRSCHRDMDENDCPSAISTGRLHPSRGSHLRPIKHIISMRPHTHQRARSPHLGDGFPLRCFQRLSDPGLANRPRHWRDDRHTRGLSTLVLSYWGQLSSRLQRAQRIETKLSHDVLNPARVPL
jgi:hypothetical protein